MGIKAYKQIEALSVTLNLLDQDTQNKIGKINTIETDLSDFKATKGQANGIAPLGADSLIPGQYIGSLYSTEVFVVAAMSELTDAELVHPVTGEAPQPGDVAIINTGNTETQKSMILSGADHTVAANWSELLGPTDGVFSLSNTSGTLTNQRGTVTLADIAFTGDVADLTGLADVATSGEAGDVSIADAGGLYDATTAEAAFAEVMAKLNQEIDDRTNALNSAVADVTIIEGTITGTQNDTNNAFTVSGLDTSKVMFFYRDGVEQLSSGFASKSGANITTVISAPASDEALKVFGYPN